jgi:hypothetical protein
LKVLMQMLAALPLLLLCRSGATLFEGRAKVVGKHQVQMDGSNETIKVSSIRHYSYSSTGTNLRLAGQPVMAP